MNPELVREARREELKCVRSRRVYEIVPWSRAVERTGKPPIRTRWVDTNKGSAGDPEYRSRWVAQEFRIGVDNSLYAATPPLEAVREVISDAASNKGRIIVTIDVRRAYFYAPVAREMHVDLPLEDAMQHNERKCGRLKISLYGTRDATKHWDE